MIEQKMVIEKSWDEFRKSGLLLFINQILHVFGWAIAFEFESYDEETDTGVIGVVYPARVRSRGFDSKSVGESYSKITQYLKNNIDELIIETDD